MKIFRIKHLIAGAGIMILLILQPLPSWGKKAAVVLSRNLKVYQDAFEGFSKEPKSFQYDLVGSLDETGGEAVLAKIDGKYDAVVAIGSAACELLRSSSLKVAVVYTMVIEPVPFPEGRTASGLLLTIKNEDQFKLIRKMFPAAVNIGVIYHPANSKATVNQARSSAPQFGFQLHPIAVENSGDIEPAVSNFSQMKMDVIWVVPDALVNQPDNMNTIIQTCLKKRLPLIGVSRAHVNGGALAAFSVELSDLGAQTSRLTAKVMNGSKEGTEMPEKITVYVNKKIQEVLGLANLNAAGANIIYVGE